MRDAEKPSNAALLLPHALAYAVYVVVASVPESWLSPEASYVVRLALAGGALAWALPRCVSLRGPEGVVGSVAAGIAAGLLGTALWIGLRLPFAAPGAEPWSSALFGLRILVSGTVVAVIEEVLFRGYLLRLAVQWDRARRSGSADAFGDAFERSSVRDLEPGAWTPLAVVLSSVAFALGHAPEQYPASIAYGALMAGVWILRKDLIACAVAHGTTNAVLALFIYATGQWGIW